MKDPKAIFITGASSGIGEALAMHYAAPGLFLALTGRNRDRLNAVAARCREKGARVETALINVTDKAAMQNWIEKLDDASPLDLVIANAGISGGTGGDAKGEPLMQARAIFDVNVEGVFNTIEPILPRMLMRKRGQIAIMSSLAAFRGWPGAPSYSASKGAIRFYGEAMRGALAHTGVKINVICPGFIETRMTASNDYKMPFMISSSRAACIIAFALSKNKGRIAFPFRMYLLVGMVSFLPDFFAQKLLRILPAKPQDPSIKNEEKAAE